MADQPVGQFSQPARRGGKGLRLAAALPGPRPGEPHAGHHRRFVHVEARTPRVHDVHGAAFPEGAGRLWVKNFLMRDHSARAVSTRWGTSKRPGSGSAPGFVGTINVTDLWTLHARSIRSFSGTGSGDSHMMGSAETPGDVSGETPTMAQQQADALGLLAETALHHGIDPGAPGERYQVVVHVDAPVLAVPISPASRSSRTARTFPRNRPGAWHATRAA